jgi:hypothetical protein|tara:strand:- start:499 stop:981 length:483 start_codon:yes stop_codon:yes gene_type:complete
MANTKDQSQLVPPDAEIIARQWALSQTAITDIVGTNVATRLPRGSSLPFLVLFRAGGALINPRSDAHIQNALLPMECYAGRWGGSGNDKPFADYSTAMSLANAVIQSAFNYANTYITTSDSNTRAKIYGFEIVQFPTRVEEVSTGLGRYSIALAMTYRAV